MADVNEKVMEMVRKELEKNPDAENKELYQKATEVDDAIDDLTLRQFHARYPLQVKRRLAQKKGGGKGGRKKKKKKKRSRTKARAGSRGGASSGPDREAIRGTLLQFAKDVSAAEGKAEMIDLLTSVDGYVDQIVEALDGGG